MDNALSTVDASLRAYTLQYVALLTEDQPRILGEFVRTHEISKLFNFIMDPDVDVQHNSMAVLRNLLGRGGTAEEVRGLANYRGLFSAAACPYPALQNLSLDLILLLVSTPGKSASSTQLEFTNNGGLDLLFTILFIFHWRDLHPKCLKILWHLGSTLPQVLNMDNVNGLSKLVQYITFIIDDELQELDLDLIIKVAKFSEARLVLSGSGVVPVLKDLLQTASEQTKLKAVEALSLLALPPSDTTHISLNDPVLVLLDILRNKENSMELRRGTAKTLASVAREVPVCVLTLSKKNNFGILKGILMTEQSNIEFVLEVLEIVSTVLGYPTHLSALLTKDLTKTLLSLLQALHIRCGSAKLLAPVLHVLSLTLARESGRYLFSSLRGVMDVMKILYKAKDKETIDTVGDFLKTAFKDPFLASIFIRVGISSWFSSHRPACDESAGMRDALSALLARDRSLKFQLVGRLEAWERTADGFYVCRPPTPPQDDLLLLHPDLRSMEAHTHRPLYYLSMGLTATQPPFNQDSLSLIELRNLSEDTIMQYDSHPGEIEELRQQSGVPLPVDNRLLDIYYELEEEIEKNEIVSKCKEAGRFHQGWTEEMARLVGGAVARAMGGRSSDSQCTSHTFELHMKELMLKYGSHQIPLGALEVGLKLERAVLFKVLADAVGLPCALARGDCATGWVELAAPRLGGAVCPHWLVDLVESPGRLLPLESALASEYRGRPTFLGTLAHRLERSPETSPSTTNSYTLK